MLKRARPSTTQPGPFSGVTRLGSPWFTVPPEGLPSCPPAQPLHFPGEFEELSLHLTPKTPCHFWVSKTPCHFSWVQQAPWERDRGVLTVWQAYRTASELMLVIMKVTVPQTLVKAELAQPLAQVVKDVPSRVSTAWDPGWFLGAQTKPQCSSRWPLRENASFRFLWPSPLLAAQPPTPTSLGKGLSMASKHVSYAPVLSRSQRSWVF